jgi:hypothetical protein
MIKTYRGSCHCGTVRFEADIDLGAGTGRCNCSFCTKARWWGTTIKPEAFRLLEGEKDLSEYRWATGQARHLFCRHCGVRSFGRGDIPEIGGAYVSINVAALDNVTPEELAALPVRYLNGRADDWMHEPAVKSYL